MNEKFLLTSLKFKTERSDLHWSNPENSKFVGYDSYGIMNKIQIGQWCLNNNINFESLVFPSFLGSNTSFIDCKGNLQGNLQTEFILTRIN